MTRTIETRNLIGGVWTTADDRSTFDVVDPATGNTVASVPNVGSAEVRRAIDAASAVRSDWEATPVADRIEILHRIAAGLLAAEDDLAAIIVSENGKPMREARAEVAYAASFFPAAADAVAGIEDEFVPVDGKRVRVRYRPVGVSAAITPWNFPLAMLAKKTAPALATGCPQIVKPAEQTPLSAIAFAQIAMEAGVPSGVLSLVTGDPAAIGAAILGDPRVRKLSFTGSTEVGRLLMRGAAERMLRLSLELGGHAPMLVFEDADLDEAVRISLAAKFRNGGQTCVCPNRFLVQRRVHDAFVDRLAKAVASLRSGHGLDHEVDLGPLIDDAGMAKVMAHIDDAVANGATVVTGGGRRVVPGCVDRFPEPTVLTGVGPGMRCWHEETFGPVCPVRAFDDEAEAIALANDTEFGLASYAITQDDDRTERLGRSLESGIIGINDPVPAIAVVPFGGLKLSGFGREGGKWGVHEYLEPVTVSRR
ncbi:MAG: putative succinate-semialdehyde dehydrogenase oxidoreductase protein [Planctomycetota bacterium]